MQKETLLQELRSMIDRNELSREEVASYLGVGAGQAPSTKNTHSDMNIIRILYYLGGTIVLLGIGIFIAQFWDDLGAFGHVLVTLGSAFAFYAAGVFFIGHADRWEVGVVFHTLGGLLFPTGILVLLHELSTGVYHPWIIAGVFVGLTIMYLISLRMFHHVVFALFAILFGTTALYTIADAALSGPFYSHTDFYAYLTMAIGIGYGFLAHSFKNTLNERLSGALVAFGSLGFLSAAFSRVFDSGIWELLYIGVVSGAIILATKLKSKALLVFGTLFFIAHVIFLTDKYFADSLGWPVALILLGFIIIGIGYNSFRLSKKYLTGTS